MDNQNPDMTSTLSLKKTEDINNKSGDGPIHRSPRGTESTDSGTDCIHDSDEEMQTSFDGVAPLGGVNPCDTSSKKKTPLLSLPDSNLKLLQYQGCGESEDEPEQPLDGCCGDAPAFIANEPIELSAVDDNDNYNQVEQEGEPTAEEQAAQARDHELTSSWTMYYRANKPDNNRDSIRTAPAHEDKSLSTQKIAKISTVEQFWQVINHMTPPSKIQKRIGPNLMFFRDDIYPEWEDPANRGGGTWALILNEKHIREMLNELWLETLIACIGEALSRSEYITGVVLQRRQREDRLQLWTRCGDEKEIQLEIGQCFKKMLNLPVEKNIHYTKHDDMEVVSTSHRPGSSRWNSKSNKKTGQDRDNFSTGTCNGNGYNNNNNYGYDHPSVNHSEDTESRRGSAPQAPGSLFRSKRGPARGGTDNGNAATNNGKNNSTGNTSYGFMLEKLDRLCV